MITVLPGGGGCRAFPSQGTPELPRKTAAPSQSWRRCETRSSYLHLPHQLCFEHTAIFDFQMQPILKHVPEVLNCLEVAYVKAVQKPSALVNNDAYSILESV